MGAYSEDDSSGPALYVVLYKIREDDKGDIVRCDVSTR